VANKSNPNWIEDADLSKGALSSKAKKSSMSTMGFAKINKDSPGTLGKQSRLAQTLSKLRRSGKVG
jgi:hypothetical protein